jgi:hypothetical protein
MSNEHRFFESCAAAASPDWSIKLDTKLQPGQIDLASRTVRLYLVDTSSDWTAAGAFAPSGFAQAASAARAVGLRGSALADAAGQMIGSLGKADLHDAQALERCLQLVAAALTATRTYELMLSQQKSLAGHWVYIAYRGHDASITCRPVYFSGHEIGFVSTTDLANIVRQIVSQDLRTPGGSVSQMLKKAGGAILASCYK